MMDEQLVKDTVDKTRSELLIALPLIIKASKTVPSLSEKEIQWNKKE